jgi:hypothetical protein
VYHENATRSAVIKEKTAVRKEENEPYEAFPCQLKALDGIPSIEGIESSKLVLSESPDSSRTSKEMSIGETILAEEGTPIAAKETDDIPLISFLCDVFGFYKSPNHHNGPKNQEVYSH